MKLVIDRQAWLRGEGEALSRLLRSSDGKRCCLGFYGRALGFTDALLQDFTSPGASVIHSGRGGWPDWILSGPLHTWEAVALMAMNDNLFLSEEEREKKIREVFARNGVEVEFVDTPAEPLPSTSEGGEP